MIPYNQALQLVINEARPLGLEKIKIEKALGRVVARDILSPIPLPPFNNSAVDGYALRSSDTQETKTSRSKLSLKLLAEQRAGTCYSGRLKKKTALKIMTGAPVPLGADAVIPKEEVEERDGQIFINRTVNTGENIRLAGEDVKKGEKIIEAGTELRPVHIGLLAACGQREIWVYRQPRIYVIVTGDELLSPGKGLKKGLIYDANSFLIRALVEKSGARVVALKRVKDKLKLLKRYLQEALRKADIILTSGGVSVGDYDLVKVAVEKIGGQRIFWQVAQKPAKPLAFYKLKKDNSRTYLFGLPGNPGAVFISFLEYVQPFIKKMMGRKDFLPREVEAVLAHPVKKKKGRLNFYRVKLKPQGDLWLATSAGRQESGILFSLIETDGLGLIPAENDFLEAGSKIKVHLID